MMMVDTRRGERCVGRLFMRVVMGGGGGAGFLCWCVDEVQGCAEVECGYVGRCIYRLRAVCLMPNALKFLYLPVLLSRLSRGTTAHLSSAQTPSGPTGGVQAVCRVVWAGK